MVAPVLVHFQVHLAMPSFSVDAAVPDWNPAALGLRGRFPDAYASLPFRGQLDSWVDTADWSITEILPEMKQE